MVSDHYCAPPELAGIVARARTLAAAVPDPEIPVVSIEELGILRDVRAVPHGAGWVVEVVITPTYSGCPAMDAIKDDILAELDAHEIPSRVRTQLAPAWTTDWISDAAKEKLRQYGIAPPSGNAHARSVHIDTTKIVALHTQNTRTVMPFDAKNAVSCPQCGSGDTVEVNYFGSTACKAQYRCLNCKEPFDYFKPY
jgi:ring-1,2-phenylacetyl-CoA epoxidase subunit PaaD